MPGSTSRERINALVRLRSRTPSISCSVSLGNSRCGSPPALLISTSTGPSSRSTVSMTARRSAADVTSAVIARTRPPREPRSRAVASSSAWLRATSATRAPRSVSAAAMWGPMPREPPVTIAVAPSRSRRAMACVLSNMGKPDYATDRSAALHHVAAIELAFMGSKELPRRRPGGQMDPEADRLILETAKRLMREQGYERLTVDGVAKQAGVARTTVYRRYRDKAELVSAAIDTLRDPSKRPDSGDARRDLVQHVENMRRNFDMSLAGTLLMEEPHNPRLIALFRERMVHPRRQIIRHSIEKGIERGQVRHD